MKARTTAAKHSLVIFAARNGLFRTIFDPFG
jgi:hypothetical protein